MAQRKKRRKYRRKSGSDLGATPKEHKEIDQKQLGLTVLSFAAGQFVGAAVGKTSGYAGTVISGLGVWKKNLYATSFGAGMAFSEANGPSGFSIDSIKERSLGYAKTIGGKYLSPMGGGESTNTTKETGTSGLGEGTNQPKYFLNPYTQNQDFSQAMRDLENIETKVREVSGIEDEVGDLSEENY